MSETKAVDKRIKVLSQFSEDCSKARQSVLWRDLEVLLNLKTSELRSNLLLLPREIRDQIFEHAIPIPKDGSRTELHTCFWGADMMHEPWSHTTFGYAASVPAENKLDPRLLLINRQLHDEVLQTFFRQSKLILHAELRNSDVNNLRFDYSPHVLQLPMLKHVTHVRFYVEWNYFMLPGELPIQNQIRITDELVTTMDKLLASLQALETIHLSILFFWKHRSGKPYHLTMQELFDLEDLFEANTEHRWLQLLRKTNDGNTAVPLSPNPSSAGVGYKLSTESKGTDASGSMEIFVSQNLKDAMQERRESMLDFYGNYGIADPLPLPSFTPGAMI
jgi:hypothetical protein